MPRQTPFVPRSIPLWLAALLAVLVGAAVPIQSRINGELGATLGDPIMASLLPFGSGLVVLLLISLPLPKVRRGLRSLPSLVARRTVPPYYLVAGTIGVSLVLTQTTVVPLVGVAIFTVSVVAGQVVGGVIVDTLGFAQAVRRPADRLRLTGAGLVLVAVAVSVSPGLGGVSLLELAVPAVVAFVVGALNGFQYAMNGRIGSATGSPLVATVTNFVAGTALLAVLLGARAVVVPMSWTWSTDWWAYTGGLLGIIFIGGTAALIPHAGALVTGLGSVAGQLAVSLVLDAVAPVDGRGVEPAMVVGTVLALVAIVLTTVPRRRRG